MVVLGIARQNSPQVGFVEDDHVVQTFSTNRANQTFHVWRLPGRSVRDDNFPDAHVIHAFSEVRTVDPIVISYQETRRFVIWKRLNDLLACPTGCWMEGDVERDDTPPVMPKDNEAVQQLKSNGWHDEEIDGRDVLNVILKECTPGLGGRSSMSEHVLRHRRLVHRVAEQRQLRLNPRRSPRGVLPRHAPDQATDLCVDPWTPGLAARLPPPAEVERALRAFRPNRSVRTRTLARTPWRDLHHLRPSRTHRRGHDPRKSASFFAN